jgi:hypothetical protein
LGHAATPRFLSPLIEMDMPISGIQLSDRLHRKAHDAVDKGASRECAHGARDADDQLRLHVIEVSPL